MNSGLLQFSFLLLRMFYACREQSSNMDFNDFLFGDSEFAASSSQQPQDDVFVLSEQDRNRYKNLFESMVLS